MVEYTSIKAILNRVSRTVRTESYDSDLLSSALEGYRSLGFPAKYTNKVDFYELTNNCVQLTDDIRSISMVTYLIDDPRTTVLTDLCDTLEEEEEEATCADCFTNLSKNCAGFAANFPYMAFLNSTLYNTYFYPLSYIPHTKPSNICKFCISQMFDSCVDTYSVDEDKILYSSLKTGFICVDYNTEVLSSDGDYLIPKDENLLQFLARYAEEDFLRSRVHMHEQGALAIYEMAKRETGLAKRRAWGSRLLKNADINKIMAVSSTMSPTFLMTKLPQIYYKEVLNG
jgi:hypothetical protein